MLAIQPARSCELTARIGGAYLHSPYDPRTEARRFARGALTGTCPAQDEALMRRILSYQSVNGSDASLRDFSRRLLTEASPDTPLAPS